MMAVIANTALIAFVSADFNFVEGKEKWN